MYSNETLKSRLQAIESNDWKIPEDIDKYKLSLEAMDSLGSTDPVLRDDLALTYLWIVITEGMLSKEQLKELLHISLSEEHLFHGPLDKESDSIYNRAFTILIVRCVIYYHNKFGEDLLSEQEMQETFNAIISYARQERDIRGYVKDKGWAHSSAHLADALRTAALNSFVKHDQLLEILDVVKEKVNISSYVYINEEAERLTSAVINVIGRNELAEAEIVNWIAGFGGIDMPKSFPEAHYWRENIKNLLRSLYFRLKAMKAPGIYLDKIEEVQNGITVNFYKTLE